MNFQGVLKFVVRAFHFIPFSFWLMTFIFVVQRKVVV